MYCYWYPRYGDSLGFGLTRGNKEQKGFSSTAPRFASKELASVAPSQYTPKQYNGRDYSVSTKGTGAFASKSLARPSGRHARQPGPGKNKIPFQRLSLFFPLFFFGNRRRRQPQALLCLSRTHIPRALQYTLNIDMYMCVHVCTRVSVCECVIHTYTYTYISANGSLTLLLFSFLCFIRNGRR